MASTLTTAFRDTYDLAFQVSPIILNGGSYANSLGGMMPIIGLLNNVTSFAISVATNGLSMNDFPVRFVPIPGGSIINNAVGTYPFANQQVAANAIIKQPTHVSLLMIAPVNSSGGYLTKLAYITSLQTALDNHINAGGTFHIATPGFIYTDCLLTSMTDVTGGDTRQQQVSWQLDFVKPLITQQQASTAYSALMNKLSNGFQVTAPSWSGPLTAVGESIQGAANAVTTGVTNITGAINNFASSSIAGLSQ